MIGLLGLAVLGGVFATVSAARVGVDRRPRVALGVPVHVGERAATLRGTVTIPAGRRTLTYRWEYGTRRLALRTRARRVASVRIARVRGDLKGLRPGVRYRFRLVATTCGGCPQGTTRSAVRTFRTGSSRSPASVTSPAVPISTSGAPVSAPPHDPSPSWALGTPPVDDTYANPVAGVIADPTVVDAGASGDHDYHLYATGTLFPIWRSPDLVHWVNIGTAFTARPGWTVQSGDWHPWAPGVLRSSAPCPGEASPTCFVMYYTALHGTLTPRPNCVGVAVSSRSAGPFTDLGPLTTVSGGVDAQGRPVGCGDDAGYGNIDPAPFVDGDGRAYLYVSTDRRCDTPATCRLEPTISVIPLATDLLHAAGSRKAILKGEAGWEVAGSQPLVENPWMERRGSRYHLFYSGGNWRGPYGMGHATATSPTGAATETAFSKPAENPILRQTAAVRSPGGGMLVRGPAGADWLVYHGRADAYEQPRTLRIDPVVWDPDETVRIDGPTVGPRSPVP